MSEQAGLILPILATDNGTIAAVSASLEKLDKRLDTMTSKTQKAVDAIKKAEEDAASQRKKDKVKEEPKQKNIWEAQLEGLRKYILEIQKLNGLSTGKGVFGDITEAKVLIQRLEGPALAMRKLALDAAKASASMSLYNEKNISGTRIQLNGIAAVKERIAMEARLASIRAKSEPQNLREMQIVLSKEAAYKRLLTPIQTEIELRGKLEKAKVMADANRQKDLAAIATQERKLIGLKTELEMKARLKSAS